MKPISRTDGESVDHLIKRFKRACNRSGILAEYRKRQSYKKPSEKRRDKHSRHLTDLKKRRRL